MEREYVLITDTNTDLPREFFEENGIPTILMPFQIDGVEYTERDMTHKQFYDQLRQGKLPTTMQFNAVQATAFMEPFVQQGKDVLHVCFSSGMSATCESCTMAARELEEKYPGSKVRVLDSLCASMGEGLLFYKMWQMKKAGKSLDEVLEWGEENRLRIAHLVMAEDLMHLHRGGRVSKASAVMGSMLGIKPIIHVNNDGKLIAIGKARGRKQGMQTLVDMMEKLTVNHRDDVAFINHSDCREDAEALGEMAKKRLGVREIMINYIGPVIGAHTGIGTVSLFMLADHR